MSNTSPEKQKRKSSFMDLEGAVVNKESIGGNGQYRSFSLAELLLGEKEYFLPPAEIVK